MHMIYACDNTVVTGRAFALQLSQKGESATECEANLLHV
jgi:hypothetical protein